MRNTFVFMAAAAALVSGFGAGSAGAGELNTPPPGFKALFNGKDLTNWKGLIDIKRKATLTPEQLKTEQAKADEKMRAHWSVKPDPNPAPPKVARQGTNSFFYGASYDPYRLGRKASKGQSGGSGILTFDGKGDSLQTIRDYGDFELYVDWRIQPKGDSGIYLRGNPQVQIWDRAAGSAVADGKFIGSGGLFNNQKNPSRPIAVADKPAGEWNTFFIRMVGDRVTVKLNGQTVVDNTPLENYWERGKPLPVTGPIELQNHGNILEFRNIYVREL